MRSNVLLSAISTQLLGPWAACSMTQTSLVHDTTRLGTEKRACEVRMPSTGPTEQSIQSCTMSRKAVANQRHQPSPWYFDRSLMWIYRCISRHLAYRRQSQRPWCGGGSGRRTFQKGFLLCSKLLKKTKLLVLRIIRKHTYHRRHATGMPVYASVLKS